MKTHLLLKVMLMAGLLLAGAPTHVRVHYNATK